MTKRSFLPVKDKLARIDQWRASGMKLKDYLLPLGEDLAMWTSWLRWEKHWRGLDGVKLKSPVRGTGFVQAVKRGTEPTGGAVDGVRVVLRSDAMPGLQAQVCWPVGQELAAARWLRDVFK